MQSIENMADPTDNKGIFLEGRFLPNRKIRLGRNLALPLPDRLWRFRHGRSRAL
jgi:hypothetical protein